MSEERERYWQRGARRGRWVGMLLGKRALKPVTARREEQPEEQPKKRKVQRGRAVEETTLTLDGVPGLTQAAALEAGLAEQRGAARGSGERRDRER